MKKVFILLLLLILCVGCQSVSYRWVKDGFGFPSDCPQVYRFSDAEIRYCLVPDASVGGYYFEGILQFTNTEMGNRIGSGSLSVFLSKNGEVVYRGRLARQGTDPRKPIYLHGDLWYDGEYDEVDFVGELYGSQY